MGSKAALILKFSSSGPGLSGFTEYPSVFNAKRQDRFRRAKMCSDVLDFSETQRGGLRWFVYGQGPVTIGCYPLGKAGAD